MKKTSIDDKTYSTIMIAMKKNGITKDIISLAKKMDMNLVQMIYEKLIIKPTITSRLELSKNLLGIYGNYFATYYYSKLGYKVENEYPLYDSNGDLRAKIDLYFVDKEGNENYCEVKATKQILYSIRNYKDSEEESLNFFVDNDNEIIKYKNIGKKLIKQVEKIHKAGKKPLVIVYKNCYIDNIIKEKLKSMNANIVTLAMDIEELEIFCENLVDKLYSDLKIINIGTKTK